ncbi:unnamed protein product [Chironomus riparius]|uniref:Uncharacterized protein n=1 Tax=Chironomus riparius TaxID=315576 RepID=A0A9N9RN41_9DIPT|nr:unnamed protein product [Chironomus riparius]
MDLRNFLSWFSDFQYFRLFDNDKIVKTNDLELVCLSNSNFDAGLSSELTTVDNCESIDNIFNYFESPKLSNLLKVNDKVYLFKLQVKEALNSAELCKLANKFVINSVVILLSTENETRFYLYWKSNKIQHFLIFKIYKGYDFMNNLQLFEFIATFLGNSLRSGHLGLHNQVQIHPESNSYELHLLADHRNYNLLLIAAEMGNAYVANFILDGGISTEVNDMNAQTLAWNGRHFEIVFELLKSNHKFPDSINIEECPDSIKEFAQISHELNEAMILRNTERVLEIVSNNRKMKHFYNLENESALAFALRNKLFDIYRLLISENIKFGPHEKFSEIKDSMRQSDKEQLREIHYKESKFLPENHMHVLLSNSRLGHGTIETEKKYEIIQKAFEVLNENPLIQVILMIVAASRNFRIIFDFNCDSVEVMDPTANETTRGLFYSTGRIYVAVKKLLNESTKYDALGTLAHEMCHYAVNLVYKNLAKPYSLGDDEAKIEFENILTLCKGSCSEEEIIELVFNCYPHNMQHAELIVRVPHLIMLYFNDQNKFEEVRKIFIKLFEVFEQKVIPDMKEALPNIETKAEFEVQTKNRKIRNLKLISIIGGLLAIIIIISGFFITRSIFYKPTYKFSTLSNSDKLKIATAPIDYKNVRLEFYDLFPKSSKVYEKLTSDHISNMLKGNKPLNLSDSSAFYFHNFIYHNWKILSENLKQKVLNSNFTFQNQTIKFGDVSQVVLESLSSQQIVDVLDNKALVVQKMPTFDTKFYIERNFFDEMIYEIYFKFMVYVNDGEVDKRCNYSMKKNMTFEDFYQNYSNYDDIEGDYDEMILDITDRTEFRKCKSSGFKLKDIRKSKVVDKLLDHKLDFNKLLEETLKTRFFILSAKSGAGKTVTFQKFTTKIKERFPTFWVSLINFNNLKDGDKEHESLEDVIRFLEKNLNLSSNNEFERKLFNNLFTSNKTILLWDGIKEHSPLERIQTVDNVLKKIWLKTGNIQFLSVGNDDNYLDNSNKYGNMFSSKTYIFVPLEFSNEILLQNFDSNKSAVSFIEKNRNLKNVINMVEDHDKASLIKMIAELMSNGKSNVEIETVYEIYESFLTMKIDLWIKSDFERMQFKNWTNILINTLQENALNKLSKSFTFVMNKEKYIKRKSRFPNAPRNHTIDDFLSIGILNNERKFINNLFAEFLVAKLTIDKIYNLNELDNSTIEELDLRLRIFCGSFENEQIFYFIDSYLQRKQKAGKFNSKLSKLIKTKYRRLLENLFEVNRMQLMPILLNFFSKDHELLIDILKINQDKTFYTELFNYARYDPNYRLYYYEVDLEFIKYSTKPYLNETEMQKFLYGTNQKGIMLFSLYCFHKNENSGSRILKKTPYNLEKNLLKSKNPNLVFEAIVKNLTINEYKELLLSRTILKPVNVLTKEIYILDQKMLKIIYEKLTIQEQKEWLIDALPTVLLTENKIFPEMFLTKITKIFSNSEIFKVFQDNQILQITLYYNFKYKNFDMIWDFFTYHTTKNEQKLILSQEVEIECTDEFKLRQIAFPSLRDDDTAVEAS